jgi:cysteine-rich repeat protein
VCGNTLVEPGEECDQGPNNGDQPGRCRQTCKLPVCGDGIRDLNEQCDDGNGNNNDVCSNSCAIRFSGAPLTNQGQSTVGRYQPQPRAIPYPEQTQTGPGLAIFLASGAAAGVGLVRRRFNVNK